MNYTIKWANADVIELMVLEKLKNYGHLLKWKNCKETCLDVGCEEGTVTKHVLYPYLQNHVEKLMAIDNLDGMILFARLHNSHKNIEYKTVDILNDGMITTMHNQFDHLFSFLVSYLISDIRSFLTNLHKILKSDGQIFVIALADNFFKQVLYDLYQGEKCLKYKFEKPIFMDYTSNPVQHITELLQDVGFKVDLCEYEDMLVTTDNLKGFVESFVDTYRFLKIVPTEFCKMFFKELLQKCREKCIHLGEPEKYDMPHKVLVFIATKLS